MWIWSVFVCSSSQICVFSRCTSLPVISSKDYKDKADSSLEYRIFSASAMVKENVWAFASVNSLIYSNEVVFTELQSKIEVKPILKATALQTLVRCIPRGKQSKF